MNSRDDWLEVTQTKYHRLGCVNIRFYLLLMIVVGVGLFILTHQAALIEILNSLLASKFEWLALALVLQGVYYFTHTLAYQLALKSASIKATYGRLFKILLSSMTVNALVPASGNLLVMNELITHDQPMVRVAAGWVIAKLIELVAFAVVVILSFGYLATSHVLAKFEIIGMVVLLLLVTCLSLLWIFVLYAPNLTRLIFQSIQKLVNRTVGRLIPTLVIDSSWVEKNFAQFREVALAVKSQLLIVAGSFGLYFTAHMIDIFSLYGLFLAVGVKTQFGVVLAGYGISTLFWVVTITPQGIGTVEASLVGSLILFKIPLAKAVAITIIYRGLTFWLPFLLGFLALIKTKSFSFNHKAISQFWQIKILAICVGAMAFINLISGITPSLAVRRHLLVEFLPIGALHINRLASVVLGFSLALLSVGLWRRKRQSWWLTEATLIGSALAHLIKGLDVEEMILAIGLAVWLYHLRRPFNVQSDSPSVKQGLFTLIFATMFTLIYGSLGFYILDRHFFTHYDWLMAMRQTIIMFTQYYDPGLEPITYYGQYFVDSIYLIGAITVGYSLLLTLRPVIVRQPPSRPNREKAKKIIEQFGRSSLAAINLLPDKQYYFSQGGSVISYAVKRRTAIALGDPIGPPHDIDASIKEFQALSVANDWDPVFYQVLPDHLEFYSRAGFKTLCIGQEALIDLEQFNLDGGQNKTLRNTVNRLVRLGFRSEILKPPIDPFNLWQLQIISNQWLKTVGGHEKNFSLGWFDKAYIRQSQILVVRNPKGQIVAFANIIPEYQLNESTCDLMRRLPNAENGVMDYLFVSLFDWAKKQGFKTFNLGLSPLAQTGVEPSKPPIEKGLRFIYNHLNQFYSFKGLYQFKKKFHPIWSPRYLIYPNTTRLPIIALAIVEANAGQRSIWKILISPFFAKPT